MALKVFMTLRSASNCVSCVSTASSFAPGFNLAYIWPIAIVPQVVKKLCSCCAPWESGLR